MSLPNNSRTLVQLDDKIIEIKKSKRGLVATELEGDDAISATFLEEGIDKLIENDMNKLANEAYKELCSGFKSTLKANALRIAGFEDRWGHGYEVDHCNGRSSLMTEYISSKVQQMITTEIDTFFDANTVASILKDTKKALLAECKEQFERVARQELRRQVDQNVKEFLSGVVKQHMTKFQKRLIKDAEVKFFGSKQDDNQD